MDGKDRLKIHLQNAENTLVGTNVFQGKHLAMKRKSRKSLLQNIWNASLEQTSALLLQVFVCSFAFRD